MTMTDHRIRCVTCADGYHSTVAEVRACATGSAESAQDRADALPEGTYEKNGQRFHVRRSASSGHKYAMLLNAQTGQYDYAPGAVKTLAEEHLVKRHDARGRAKAAEPAEGIYRHPASGEILKVYRTVHGANKLCVKRLILPVTGSVHEAGAARFEYLGLAVNYIEGHVRLSLEEAQEYGRLYGLCVRCGRTLTDEESIARGIGPDCAAKEWAA
jgi:hypothetical protein